MRNLKKVLALVLAMAMSLSLAVTAGAAFKDDDKIADKYATAVEFAAQTGILEGFEDGSYGPQKNLTRAQLATMTYRIATGDVEDAFTADFAGGAAAAFTDTAADAWYAGYVGYAADAGYLKGVGDGLYKPNSAMTGYQALAAFLRVVGYNQPGQFTGADWTVQVAQVAYEIGALEGITNVDLNAAISREVAAQIIFNILFADLVDYTPAFGYQNALFEGSLATDVFEITGHEEIIATAPWGQPAEEWYSGDDTVVSIPYAPVATYTEAINECDLAKDLGLTEVFGDETDDETIVEFLNGEDANVVAGNIDLVGAASKEVIGDQGTLTEIYEFDGEFWFVQIETWLAKVVETSDAEFDKNGHEKAPATATIDIYGIKADVELKTAEYDVDDYVLVNISKWDANDYEYYLTDTAPVATGVQTKIDVNAETSTIGGTTYNWAAKYVLGFSGLLNTEYEVFVDFYGNVIGIQEPAPADPVYTIFEKAIEVTNGFDPYVAGKVVDLATGDLKDITVCSYDKFNAWTDDEVTYVHAIVEYVECEDGYEMTYAADVAGNDYSIVNGTPRIVIDDETYVSDNNTVYAVEMECGEYEIYTGYKAVPSMTGTGFGAIEILDDDADGYVDLVYVDASNALFAGEEYFAYVMTSTKPVAGGALADETLYETVANVVMNGEVVEVDVQAGFASELVKFAGLAVTLKTDADGLVYAAEAVEGFTPYAVYAENSDEVIFVTNADGADKSYVVTEDTIIWVVNEIDNWAEVGSADDVVPGYDAAIKVADDGVSADTIIIWDKTVD